MKTKVNVEIIFTSDVYDEVPSQAKKGDAGIDLRSTEDFILAPGETYKVSLGAKIHIKDQDAFCALLPRSGLGSKGLVLGNTVGVIDSGYQGELVMTAFNRSQEEIAVSKGERICQAVFLPFLSPRLYLVEQFSETSERGEAGFGSSGAV